MRYSTMLTVFTLAMASSSALAQPAGPRGDQRPGAREGERRVEIERRIERGDRDADRPRAPRGDAPFEGMRGHGDRPAFTGPQGRDRDAGQHGRQGKGLRGEHGKQGKGFQGQRGGWGAQPGGREEKIRQFMAQRGWHQRGAMRPQGPFQGRGQAMPGGRAELLRRFMAQRGGMERFGAMRPQGPFQGHGQAMPGGRAEMLRRFMAHRQQMQRGQWGPAQRGMTPQRGGFQGPWRAQPPQGGGMRRPGGQPL